MGKCSAEQKKKLSEYAKSRTGEKNAFFGRTHSPETRAKIAAAARARTGRKHSPETKAKIGAAHRGRKKPPAQVAKQAATMRRLYAGGEIKINLPPPKSGPENHNYGRKLSPEHKAAVGKASKSRVWTDAQRAAVSARTKGKKIHTEAFKQALADRNRTREYTHSEATKAKISASSVWKLKKGDYRYLGWALTKKAGWVGYRSTWELRALELLDADPAVSGFQYESFSVPYVWEGHPRRTMPDYKLTLADGRVRVVEVKPKGYMQSPKEIAKREAATLFCAEHGWVYETWTESFLWPESSPRESWVSSLPTTSVYPGTTPSLPTV